MKRKKENEWIKSNVECWDYSPEPLHLLISILLKCFKKSKGKKFSPNTQNELKFLFTAFSTSKASFDAFLGLKKWRGFIFMVFSPKKLGPDNLLLQILRILMPEDSRV